MFVFFDSHGKAWTTCSGEHPDAKAFGPTGIARKLFDDEIERLDLVPYSGLMSIAAVARDQGRLVRGEEGEFDTLLAE